MNQNSWKTLLSTTIKDVVAHKEKGRHPSTLVTFVDNQPLYEVLRVLSEQQILSAPVLDVDRSEVIGFVDVLDIACFILSFWRQNQAELLASHFPTEKFFNTPVQKVLNFSLVDVPLGVFENENIELAMKIFSYPKQRIHRIGVLSEKKYLVNILSQSDLIAFLAHHIPNIRELDQVLDRSVEELNLVHRCQTFPADTPLIELLEHLFQNRLSGLGIVDHEFRLMENLSVSDFRGMKMNSFDFFSGSLLQFLARAVKSNPKRPITTISCTKATTIREIIELLHQNHLHRVFVTDNSGHFQGVVSLCDVIGSLFHAVQS